MDHTKDHFRPCVQALLRSSPAADLRLRVCPTSCRMIFLWEALRAVAADLRKLSGLCPLSRRRLFLRDATVVTVTAMFLRGATVVRVGIRSPGLR